MLRRLACSKLKTLANLRSAAAAPHCFTAAGVSRPSATVFSSHFPTECAAGVSRPSATVSSSHFISESGNVATKEKVEDVMPIATGHERKELEPELEGKDILAINYPVGPFGTKGCIGTMMGRAVMQIRSKHYEKSRPRTRTRSHMRTGVFRPDFSRYKFVITTDAASDADERRIHCYMVVLRDCDGNLVSSMVKYHDQDGVPLRNCLDQNHTEMLNVIYGIDYGMTKLGDELRDCPILIQTDSRVAMIVARSNCVHEKEKNPAFGEISRKLQQRMKVLALKGCHIEMEYVPSEEIIADAPGRLWLRELERRIDSPDSPILIELEDVAQAVKSVVEADKGIKLRKIPNNARFVYKLPEGTRMIETEGAYYLYDDKNTDPEKVVLERVWTELPLK